MTLLRLPLLLRQQRHQQHRWQQQQLLAQTSHLHQSQSQWHQGTGQEVARARRVPQAASLPSHLPAAPACHNCCLSSMSSCCPSVLRALSHTATPSDSGIIPRLYGQYSCRCGYCQQLPGSCREQYCSLFTAALARQGSDAPAEAVRQHALMCAAINANQARGHLPPDAPGEGVMMVSDDEYLCS